MGEPTETELGTFDTLTKVATWIGVETKVLDALVALLGFSDAEAHPRTLGNITVTDFEAVLGALQVENAPPSIVAKTHCIMIHKISCFVAGTKLTRVAQDAKDTADRQHMIALATATGSTGAGATPTPQATAGPPIKKIKLNILDQVLESEVAALDAAGIQDKFLEYHVAMGGDRAAPILITPLPEFEPSADQISALTAQLALGSCWVDFATWTPYNDRTRRRESFRALVLNVDGQLVHAELKGPNSFEQWLDCWHVFRVAMLMCKGASQPVLEAYANWIRKLAQRYGHECWGLLYQADHRGRLEHLERLRRRGSVSYQTAVLAASGHQTPVVHMFDPGKPWDYCFDQLIADKEFWQEQHTEGALMIRAKVSAESKFIDGDAVTGGSSSGSHDVASGGAISAAAKYAARPPVSKPTARDTRRGHAVADGKYTSNRSGAKLCSGFNDGTCTQMIKKNNSWFCAVDNRNVHQCNKCLGTHPAGSPLCQGNTTDRQPNAGFRKGGKGKKGKGGKY